MNIFLFLIPIYQSHYLIHVYIFLFWILALDSCCIYIYTLVLQSSMVIKSNAWCSIDAMMIAQQPCYNHISCHHMGLYSLEFLYVEVSYPPHLHCPNSNMSTGWYSCTMQIHHFHFMYSESYFTVHYVPWYYKLTLVSWSSLI